MGGMWTKAILFAALIAFSGIARADDAPAVSASETAANKALVTEMFQHLFVGMKADTEADKYFASDFIEHDPASADGTKALMTFFKGFYQQYPKQSTVMKRVIADGDLVAVHFHAKTTPEDRGVAGVDLFRVENGKVVEHWDVVQPIPEKSANDNTMF
jgi:predicted SnoaL-like aldol condensation-catalyzing enzyme